MALRPFVSKLIRTTPFRWLLTNKVTRMEIIQRCIDVLEAKRYLEIGVADGTCFRSIRVPEKFGVDPIPAAPAVVEELRKPGVRYDARPSDEFFLRAAPAVLAEGIDAVFIDGLHTFKQALRDCENSLRYLAPHGVILFHDCLPTSEMEACAASSYAEARRLNGPTWNGDWTGDVWKAIVTLRTRSDLSAFVLHCDHGMGVVWRAPNPAPLQLSDEQIAGLTFSDLRKNPGELVGLRRPWRLDKILRSIGPRRVETKSGSPSGPWP